MIVRRIGIVISFAIVVAALAGLSPFRRAKALASQTSLGPQAGRQSQQSSPAPQDPATARAAALQSAAEGTLGTIGETHLGRIRQITFGGQNAEAYFSADDKTLIFQHQGQFYAPTLGDNVPCDQIYTVAVPDRDAPLGTAPATPKLVSNGKGRTTCSYIFPSGEKILYSSTFAGNPASPPRPDYSKGYVWPIYDTYTIYTAALDGSNVAPLSHAPGYNAESTITRDGKHIVFTSTRNGDIDIFTMNPDGTDVKQLTHELGYDGGPFWSYDGKKIVYRAQHPQTPQEIADYKDLLSRGLIRPGNLEIWVMNADGSDKHQVTHNGAANFAPYWLPDGRRIIFASNMDNTKDPAGFDLYVINEDGSGLMGVTLYPGFDAFPMFSSDGKRLVWASNRNGTAPHETNIFIADWLE
jgi:Tol biopolymer transport system component